MSFHARKVVVVGFVDVVVYLKIWLVPCFGENSILDCSSHNYLGGLDFPYN